MAYLPTINQTALLRAALDDPESPFGLAETQEIIRRTWHVEARSVRPDHRMVGHTGFLTTARRIEPGADTRFKAAAEAEESSEAGEAGETAESAEEEA